MSQASNDNYSVIQQNFTCHMKRARKRKLELKIRIKRLDPLRAKKIFIRKAEDGPYIGFSYKYLISDLIRSGKRSQRKIL